MKNRDIMATIKRQMKLDKKQKQMIIESYKINGLTKSSKEATCGTTRTQRKEP